MHIRRKHTLALGVLIISIMAWPETARAQTPQSEPEPQLPPAAEPLPEAKTKPRQVASTPLDVDKELEVKIGEYDKLKVYMGLQTAGRVQSLSQLGVYMTTYDSTNKLFKTTEATPLARGAGTSVGNLVFLANSDDVVKVYADFFLASVGHPSQTYGGQGFILFTGTPDSLKGTFLAPIFSNVNIKDRFLRGELR